MTWKQQINDVLSERAGVKLVSAATVDDARAWKAHLVAEAARKARAEAEAQERARKAAAGPAPLVLPRDYDDQGKAVIERVRPWTMTSPEKLYALLLAVRYVVKHQIPGDVVECGVWRGGSMQAAALTLLEQGEATRELYLFDTFEGMPPPTAEDLRVDGSSASDLLAAHAQDKNQAIWAYATLEDVQAGMATVPYPSEKVHYCKGMVEDTIPSQAPSTISILRLDTDWYASTKHELEHLYDRLSPGGVLLIDDYGWWQGSRQAVDEFLAETGARLLLTRMAEGRIAVKP